LLKQGELNARVTELEQQVAGNRPAGAERVKSLGETVADDPEVKALMASGGRGKASVRVKAIVSALTTDANGSAGDLLIPDRRPGILPLMYRRLTVRDLITPGRTETNAIQYVKETGFVNNAATVSETTGALKPQSDIKFDIATTPVTTIAHWMLATRQILSDAPQLQSFIDGRLRLGLAITEENQLLMGGGTGSDLNGIYTQATAYSASTLTISGATAIDTLRVAMLQASLAEFPATGIVLHPTDWAAITLIKTTDNNYLFSQPQGMVTQTLWGLPVVATTAMTEDKFLIGAFNQGAQLFDRWDADVLVSTEDSDNFRKNLVTILAEERLALAVYRPEAFIKGDLARIP
jgi:HK97 family phage major capsid protein